MHYFNTYSTTTIDAVMGRLGFQKTQNYHRYCGSRARSVLKAFGWTQCDTATQNQFHPYVGTIFAKDGQWFIGVVSDNELRFIGTNRQDITEFWAKIEEAIGIPLDIDYNPVHYGRATYAMNASFPAQLDEFAIYTKMQKVLKLFGPRWDISVRNNFIRLTQSNFGSAKFVARLTERQNYMLVKLSMTYSS